MDEVEDFRVDRVCPRCRFKIFAGFRHEEQPQLTRSNVVVCRLKKVPAGMILKGPLVDVLDAFLTERTEQ